MRAVLPVTFLILLALDAHARTTALQNSVSPDHRYRIQVAETGNGSHIWYQIVRTRDSSIIHSIPSSYQPEEGELEDWSWNHSTDAEVAWSAGGHYVSIDEQVHRFIGEVLIVQITRGSARDIKVPEDAMITATKHLWDRHRIRVMRGWISDDRISLVLAGRERQTYSDLYFEIILHIKAGKASIISCRDVTNKA
jgi:hypothetical protein